MDDFDAIVREYTDRIYGFAYRMTGDGPLAEDITQETFIKAWKGYAKFSKDRSVKPWLFAIAKNAAIDALRKRRDVPFALLSSDDEDDRFEDNIEDVAPLPDEFLARSDLAHAVDRAIEKLPAAARAVVLLHDQEGMTFEEVGESLGEPMNTVKSRYRRALDILRRELGSA